MKLADLEAVQSLIEDFAELKQVASPELDDKLLGLMVVMLVELRAARSVVAAARETVVAAPLTPSRLPSVPAGEVQGPREVLRRALDVYDAIESYEHG